MNIKFLANRGPSTLWLVTLDNGKRYRVRDWIDASMDIDIPHPADPTYGLRTVHLKPATIAQIRVEIDKARGVQ